MRPGEHDVTVHVIAWQDEPGATGPDGWPADHALPDYVVLVIPAVPGTRHRTESMTFARPE